MLELNLESLAVSVTGVQQGMASAGVPVHANADPAMAALIQQPREWVIARANKANALKQRRRQ